MKKIIVLLSATLFLMFSCTDVLDIDPVSLNSGDQFWNEGVVSVEKALAGTYAQLRKPFADGRWITYGDLASEFTVRYNSHSWWVFFPVTEGEDGRTYNHERLEWLRDWSDYYKVVSSANILIKHTEEMPSEKFSADPDDAIKMKNNYLGEAHFIRAFAYFYMVRVWGDLPIYKEGIESSSGLINEDGETKDLAQSPETEVLDFIREDLDKAISYLDYNTENYQTKTIRANKATAYALKAHVNTWLANRDASDKNTLLTEALSCIDAVETNGGYTLEDYDNPDAMKTMFQGRSSEMIFEIYFSADNNESFRCEAGDFGRLTLFPDKTNYTNVFQLYNEDRYNLYDPVDKRQAFFRNWGRGKPWSEMNMPGDSPDEWTGTTVSKYEFFVHDDKEDVLVEDAYYINGSMPVFRLSGLKLLKAEIFTKLDRYTEARAALDASRNRCGIGDFAGSNDELIVEIIKERARELVGEGHSYFDRLRNNYFDGMTSMDEDRIAGKGYYWPVAYKLSLTNKALKQHPYWRGKVPEIID